MAVLGKGNRPARPRGTIRARSPGPRLALCRRPVLKRRSRRWQREDRLRVPPQHLLPVSGRCWHGARRAGQVTVPYQGKGRSVSTEWSWASRHLEGWRPPSGVCWRPARSWRTTAHLVWWSGRAEHWASRMTSPTTGAGWRGRWTSPTGWGLIRSIQPWALRPETRRRQGL